MKKILKILFSNIFAFSLIFIIIAGVFFGLKKEYIIIMLIVVIISFSISFIKETKKGVNYFNNLSKKENDDRAKSK